MGHINILDNICVYSIKILFIKILVGRAKLTINDGLKIENQVNNLPENTNQQFANILVKFIVKKLEIDKLKVFSSFGAKDDAFLTAMATGSVNSLVSCIIGVVLEFNPQATISRAITPTFNETNAEITLVSSFKINLINIIISLIKAKKEFKMKFKGENING